MPLVTGVDVVLRIHSSHVKISTVAAFIVWKHEHAMMFNETCATKSGDDNSVDYYYSQRWSMIEYLHEDNEDDWVGTVKLNPPGGIICIHLSCLQLGRQHR